MKRICFFSIFIYLVFGNLPRLIPFGKGNNWLLTEFLIYFVFTLYSLSCGHLIKFLRSWLPVVLLILASAGYGIILNGLQTKPLLFAIRLCTLLLAGSAAGHLLWNRFRNNWRETFSWLLMIYLSLFTFGAVIYIVFPESTLFWAFLSRLGIIFEGDPHIGRFVSTYFDPNFYAAIACIPFLISLTLFRDHYRRNSLLLVLVFSVSIFLTGSRSGIATFALIVLASLHKDFLTAWAHFNLRQRGLKIVAGCSAALILLSPLFIENLIKTAERTLRIFSQYAPDQSALYRLRTAEFGAELFMNSPFLGVGYNFLSLMIAQFSGESSLDSSVLTLLVTFGVVGTSLFFLFFVVWMLRFFAQMNEKKEYSDLNSLTYFGWNWIFYICVVVVFTCHFNNIIFYQFWLFPVVMITSYVSHVFEMSFESSKD